MASYQAFDADTVNDCLQVAAQLIDWNALDTFSQIILISQQLLASLASDPSLLQFRKRAFQVLHAVVDKGMDYPLKVDVIV